MHKHLLVLVTTLCVVGGTTSTAEARVTHEQYTGCGSVHNHNALVKKTFRYWVGGNGGDYHAKPTVKKNLPRLGAMRACWKRIYKPAYKVERRVFRREALARHFYAYIDTITPYGEYAIPNYIVQRESGGSYTARNPSSTAGGAYQQLDSTFHAVGGANYPGSHDAAQAPPWEQHKTAARLWAGGSGSGHWALTRQ